MSVIKETKRARTVLEHAKESVDNFFGAYDKMRKKKQGAPTDNEQDMLRAGLVFSAAGLDSALKELIRGSVRSLASVDSNVQDQFETFIQRQLRSDGEDVESISGFKFLAGILASQAPQERLLNEYVLYLTGTSLQSVDQLFRSAKALGAEMKLISDNKSKLTTIFGVRNSIIHELDVKFSGKSGKRQRNIRKRTDLKSYSELLLKIADEIITKVENKVKPSAS